MDITEAIEVIKGYGEQWGIEGFLEILQEMQLVNQADDLSYKEALAFRIFMAEGRKMFAPA
jgi:hypothetical protein